MFEEYFRAAQYFFSTIGFCMRPKVEHCILLYGILFSWATIEGGGASEDKYCSREIFNVTDKNHIRCLKKGCM
jgi:hypothetical protein